MFSLRVLRHFRTTRNVRRALLGTLSVYSGQRMAVKPVSTSLRLVRLFIPFPLQNTGWCPFKFPHRACYSEQFTSHFLQGGQQVLWGQQKENAFSSQPTGAFHMYRPLKRVRAASQMQGEACPPSTVSRSTVTTPRKSRPFHCLSTCAK